MAITTTTARDQYTATAAQTKFTITYEFAADTDLLVYKTLAGATPNPTADLLTLNTNYTVTGAGYGATTRYITLTSGAAAGDIITIIRNKSLARITDFQVGADLSSADLNNQFDDVVSMIQDVNMKIEKLGLLYSQNQLLENNGTDNLLPKLKATTGNKIPIWTTNATGGLIAGELNDETMSTLRSELENDQNGTDGAGIVGYYNTTTATQETVRASLNNLNATVVGNNFPTGAVLMGVFSSTPSTGWIFWDSGTIGNAASNATNRANADTEALFTRIWDDSSGNHANDNYIPLYTSAGAIVTRGASAAADYAANRAIQLPPTARLLGVSASPATAFDQTFTADHTTEELTLTSTDNYLNGMRCTLSTTGTLPTGLAASTEYLIYIVSATKIKLASTQHNLALSTYINFTSNGTGTHTLTIKPSDRNVLEWGGDNSYAILPNDLPPHEHSVTGTYTHVSGTDNYGGGGTAAYNGTGSFSFSGTAHNNTTTAERFNTMPPSLFLRAWIKL